VRLSKMVDIERAFFGRLMKILGDEEILLGHPWIFAKPVIFEKQASREEPFVEYLSLRTGDKDSPSV
jgi:hypothetical protein